MPANKLAKNPRPPDRERCTFTTRDVRRCIQYRADGDASLCVHHRRRQQQHKPYRTPEARALVAEFLGQVGELKTWTAANVALSRLFSLTARGLIKRRDAASLAYIMQVILTSIRTGEPPSRTALPTRLADIVLKSGTLGP